MKTIYYRNGHGNFQGDSVTELANGRELRVSTLKVFSGVLVTSVMSVQPTPSGGFTYAPFSDYNERIAANKVRCTEKAVRAQHEAALANIDQYIAKAISHIPPVRG